MPVDPVKIPQNVYVEDRIMGPVTLRQLLMLLAGGGVSYAIWSSVKAAGGGYASPVATIVSWIPLGIMAAFAFVKINGIPLLRFVFLMLERTQKPNVRIWSPRRGISVNFRIVSNEKRKKELPEKEKHDISQLSETLDAGPPEPTPQKPVDPNRVQTEPMQSNIDPIQEKVPPAAEPATDAQVRDITPPSQAHG